ncbi:hypothetical protein C8F01DRAFT_46184 [Mycena amicta]|nr:hypothetical protein C8F01DRAFT_46184 [Mycena amicta]
MEVDEDSEGDSRAASEDSAPASDDAEDEDRFIRLAAYARLFPHVLAAPGHRRTAARGAAIRARFVNAIHVAADEAQAEATEEALQLAREDRAARAQEARAARAQEARDIATVLEERRLLGLDVFVPWKETNAYLTADRPPEVPLHEAVDPDLACAICADVLSHPVMTSCHHIFCFICLRSNMEVSLRCPVCRQVQTVAPTSLPPFNRLLEYAVKKCYPGWQDNSKVKVEFVNLQALNGRNLV